MAQPADVDQTVLISSQPDFLNGGVSERRLRDETAMYRKQVEALDAEFERRHIALDRIFISRITAIAADPFVMFAGDRTDDPLNAEVPQ